MMQSHSSQHIKYILLGCVLCINSYAVHIYAADSYTFDAPSYTERLNRMAVSEEDTDLTEEDEHSPIEVPIEQIRHFIDVFDLVKQHYVSPLTDDQLFENALHGLVEQLDPYSRYLDAQHYQQVLEFTEGEIAQPSFKLNYSTELQAWQLNDVISGSSHFRQGLRNGMVVEKINSISISALDEKKLQNILTGSLGSTVQLQVYTNGKSQQYDVLRDRKINYDIEPYLTNDHILILKIKAFQQDTTKQIQDALKFYEGQTKIRGVLIDVRDNPGGLLAAAVDLADLFLEEGLIVTTKGRLEPSQRFQALSGAMATTYPIMILQNRRSASAAEVFTAAMKDHGRAKVIGERSYGKGAVQKLFPLKQGALQLTVSHYYTPQGHLIEGKGIEPDHLIKMDSDWSDQQILQQALDVFHQKINTSSSFEVPAYSSSSVSVSSSNFFKR